MQKTLGHHTHCNRCNLVQGQFCGDCLYMRYGENVLEVEKNVNWICPVCRGICNCSLCRTKKGWAPTGALYKKVLNLGYKSVAHYLIQTRRNQTNSGDQISDQEFVYFSNIDKSSQLNTLESEVGLDSEIADKNSRDSQELLPLSNELETSRANTLDSKTGLNSEITGKNSNDSEELVLFSNGQEISELNNLDSETGLNSEVADKNSSISRGSTVKPKGRNKKLKEAGSFEKLRSDSIASRLRKRVKVTTD
ncbi:uncharacterized protein A4U43_C08F14460 [Asparagus officinalis]|nr:uncharacterized protein A4U43_C08F14460 [Asparagus officinalis]